MATKSDFDIDQGSNVLLIMELMNPDKSPKNMTNHLLFAQMKQSFAYDSTQATKFNATVSNAPIGEITLSLTSQQTDALDPRRRYYYDVEVHHLDSYNTNIVERILEGNITIKPSVTK